MNQNFERIVTDIDWKEERQSEITNKKDKAERKTEQGIFTL